MKARRGFSTPELTRQVRRLVAARLFLYLGAMSSYFIAAQGTLIAAGVAVAVVPLANLVVRRRELADLVRVERAVEERA